MTIRENDNTLYLCSTFYRMLANPFTNIGSLIFLLFLLGNECQGTIFIDVVTQ